MDLVKSYISLTKPGIIFGNAITAAAGFALALSARGGSALGGENHPNFRLLLATLAGLSFVIASGCVFNNYIDRNIDAMMERTKNRPLARLAQGGALVKGAISTQNALIFGTALGLIGVFILAIYTNTLTTLTALLGFIVYVFMYSPMKHRSAHATLVGSVAGAVPPIVGYAAVTNNLDGGAAILFFMLIFWQMPHFYAIAMYRANEYATARVPVLPLRKNMRTVKIHILLYVLAFALTAPLLTIFGYAGQIYFAVAALLGIAWFVLALRGFTTSDTTRWARTMFKASLVILILLCVTIYSFLIPHY